jgi:hypothetical protein
MHQTNYFIIDKKKSIYTLFFNIGTIVCIILDAKLFHQVKSLDNTFQNNNNNRPKNNHPCLFLNKQI